MHNTLAYLELLIDDSLYNYNMFEIIKISINGLISFEIMLLALYQLLMSKDLHPYIKQVDVGNQNCSH